MPRTVYTLDNEDKRLVDDALHVVGGGSVRKLAELLGRSEASMRHVLAGRTGELDAPTRERIKHLMAREQARQLVDEAMGERAAARITPAIKHLLTCPQCLANAAVDANRHLLLVARTRQTD